MQKQKKMVISVKLNNRFLKFLPIRFIKTTGLVLILSVHSFLVCAEDELKVPVDAYLVSGVNPLTHEETNDILQPYTGKEQSLQDIQKAAIALEDEFRKRGYGFYQVNLTPQTLDTSTIKLSVEALLVKKINLKINEEQLQYFSRENILASVPALQKDQSPNLHHVIQQVELSNLNPVKKVNVLFSINEETFEDIRADVDVKVTKPIKYLAWLDNTGSEKTGDFRTGLGLTHYNFLDKDHELSLTYTTSPDHLKEVKQFGVNYRIPFYAQQGVVQLYSHYSDVDSGTVAGGIDVSGQGQFFGAKYEWHLPKISDLKKYSHQLIFGIDDKLFDNNVFYQEQQQDLGNNLRTTPLSLAYRAKWKDLWNRHDFYVQYERNLAVGSFNSDEFYNKNRLNADAKWDVFKFGISSNWSLPEYRISTQIDFQLTDKTLISGEQFGLGGAASKMRGFNGREVSADTGIKASVELWSAPIWNNQLSYMGFIDSGYVHSLNPLAEELTNETLVSTGFGLAFNWKGHVDLSVYLAHVLDGNDFVKGSDATKDGDNAIHFSLYLNY